MLSPVIAPSFDLHAARRSLLREGFAIVGPFLNAALCERLGAAIDAASPAAPRRRGGVRNALANAPALEELLRDFAFVALAQRLLGPQVFVARTILFDKTPLANWQVAWHQDRAIAVVERREAEGFTGWSMKEGVPHALAPADVLERMLIVRVHLDACGADRGPLQVLPGTHRLGVLNEKQIAQAVAERDPHACHVEAGGAVLMRPLLLHASSKASSPSRRRVVHLELANFELPPPLAWHERRPLALETMQTSE